MALEADDPVKSQLLRKARQQREALEDEVEVVSDRTEKILTNALVIGAALALTYFAVRQFSGSKSKKNKSRKTAQQPGSQTASDTNTEDEPSSAHNMLTHMGTVLASQAVAFLLAIAKEKLTEYLKSQGEKADEHS
jgi:hypothetical protein